MDWQLRIALLVVGILVIGYIVFDFNRRKKDQAEKQRLIEQMHAAANQVDSTGFDYTGVGNVRPARVEPQVSDNVSVTPDVGVKQSVPANVMKAGKPAAKPAPTEQMKFSAIKEPETNDTSTHNPDLVISLILKAAEGSSYRGKDFMPLLLSQGLRHGDMGIFHRHSGAAGKPGPIMYSVANAVKPGIFELGNIETFETPAFAFFITLPGPSDAIAAFEGMVKTIKLLKQELGGQILDDTKSVYTEQTYQHQLDCLREYLTKASLHPRP